MPAAPGPRAEARPLPRPRVARASGTPLASVAALSPQAGIDRSLPSPNGQSVAVIGGSGLRVNGRTVAAHAGAVVWSNDGAVLFFTAAPPVAAATTPERLFMVPAGGGTPVPLGVTDDPWRLSPTGAESVAFDDAGVLAVANAIGPTVVRTDIALSQDEPSGHSAYPFSDSPFSVSGNMRYAAVLTPQNHIELYTLARGAVPAGGSLHALGTTAVPGGVTWQDLPGTVAGDRQQWGAWTQDSRRFLYAVQTGSQRPRLELWTAATGRVTQLGGALAPAERGEFLILGWVARAPGTFLAEDVSTGAPRWVDSVYVAGQPSGRMQKLWTNGIGGSLSPGGGAVTFAWAQSPSGPMQTWVATLRW